MGIGRYREAMAVKCIWVLALLVLAAWPIGVRAGPADDATALLDRWAAAYSTSDPAAMLKLYTSDATLFGLRSPDLQIGPEHIVKFFANWPRTGTKVFIRYRRMSMLGDRAAIAVGYLQFRWVIEGKAIPRRARFTMTLVNQGNAWLIANQHFSPIVSTRPTQELIPHADRDSVAPH